MRVGVIDMGGTITLSGTSPTDVIEYVDRGAPVGLERIIGEARELLPGVELEGRSVQSAISSALGPADWLALRGEVRHASADDAFVVLHGTGTIEETAYFLALTLAPDRPVALVGAQRPWTTVSSDAQLNLVNAVRYVTCHEALGLGVVVVSNDEIHAARDVRKTANRRVNAFESPGFGPLGVVDGDRVHLPRRSVVADGRFGDLINEVDLPRVDIVHSYAGVDGALVEAAVAAGARGIVCAGFAPGSVSPGQRAALVAAVEQGVVVVQASRAVRDRVTHRQLYDDLGWVASGDLSPQKARILLMVCLAAGVTEPTELAETFASS